MFGVTFKGNYWNIVTTTEVEISVLAWFFSINIFRKERAPPSPWLIWQQRTESVEYLNIWVWQGSSQYCCVGWSLVVWIKFRLETNLWRRLLCGLGKFAESPIHLYLCWKQDNPHIYMKISVGLFCGLTLHDLCSSLQSGGNLECSRASGTRTPSIVQKSWWK